MKGKLKGIEGTIASSGVMSKLLNSRTKTFTILHRVSDNSTFKIQHSTFNTPSLLSHLPLLHSFYSYFFTKFLNAELKMTYWVFPAMVPSFCPQRKGQSSKFSKWSGWRKSSPGATLPGMNEKSALLFP